jgi:hypothetical protein
MGFNGKQFALNLLAQMKAVGLKTSNSENFDFISMPSRELMLLKTEAIYAYNVELL